MFIMINQQGLHQAVEEEVFCCPWTRQDCQVLWVAPGWGGASRLHRPYYHYRGMFPMKIMKITITITITIMPRLRVHSFWSHIQTESIQFTFNWFHHPHRCMSTISLLAPPLYSSLLTFITYIRMSPRLQMAILPSLCLTSWCREGSITLWPTQRTKWLSGCSCWIAFVRSVQAASPFRNSLLFLSFCHPLWQLFFNSLFCVSNLHIPLLSFFLLFCPYLLFFISMKWWENRDCHIVDTL